MAGFKAFEEIIAWQEGRKLVKQIYGLTRAGDLSRDFGLRDQIQRAAVSVCSNIAEGFERRGNREFIKYLWIAKGSAAEVASQIYHVFDVGYVSQDEFNSVYDAAKRIGSLIHRLIASIPNPDHIKTSSTSSTPSIPSTSSTFSTPSTSST